MEWDQTRFSSLVKRFDLKPARAVVARPRTRKRGREEGILLDGGEAVLPEGGEAVLLKGVLPDGGPHSYWLPIYIGWLADGTRSNWSLVFRESGS